MGLELYVKVPRPAGVLRFDNGDPVVILQRIQAKNVRKWRNRGGFESTEQRIRDQARAIRKNGWLSELELEMIKRSAIEEEEREANNDVEDDREQVDNENLMDVDDEENVVNDVNVEENDQQNGGFVTKDNMLENILSESQREIVENLRNIYVEKKTAEGISFKKVDKNKLKREMNRVNQVIRHIETKNITETNELIKAATVWVGEQLGLKKTEFRAKKAPWWKRRIEDYIKSIRKDVNILAREFRQNRIFSVDQKKNYKELNGGEIRTNEVPNAEESRRFWGDIWSVEKEHNKGTKWLSELKDEVKGRHSQEAVTISIESVRKQAKKIPNWKCPGKDGVQRYWLKNLANMHDRIADQLNNILMGTDTLPKWLTHGRTVLCQKDPRKGNAVKNYRPITCLPLMWKLMTGIIADQMYDYLEREYLLPDEQKGCRRRSRGTKDQLLIDKTTLKDCKKRHTNLAMNEEQIDSLIQTTHIFSTDIGMEFGIKKCGILVLKRRKIVRCEGMELPNDEIIKEVGQEGYTYLGIVELDKVKEKEMKEKTKEYKRRLRLSPS
ncbi:uncharacterized protein LOC134765239 [Penaeus indicus]|uniref:uncharacterized protein LOC134765239 n=1 Tax=Penaeus indicus TaxID=29960 RepID=UPI00300C0472